MSETPDMTATAARLTADQRRLIEAFAGTAPRYTSYPPAPAFGPAVDAERYVDWLDRLPDVPALSLYVHVPYCSRLCWFCACRTQGVRSYRPIGRYLIALRQEIEAVARRRPDAVIRSIHWGGGSPTILSADDIRDLSAALFGAFAAEPQAEFAVEIDCRDVDDTKLDALAAAGLTRASLGVQDFDPEVQAAINREQSFETTRDTVAGLRRRGVTGVNIDALYGLPGQTTARLTATIDKIVDLDPDRVALFGYAHVPWVSKRQQLIDSDTLPDGEARFAQAAMAAERLTDAGYVRVGLDHFAKPADPMAVAASAGALRRNFQGYAVDDADALLGFGASAIGRTPAGYVQNAASTADYLTRVAENAGIATARGVAFSMDDRVRAAAIDGVMCRLAFDGPALRAEFGDFADAVIAIAEQAVDTLPEGVVAPTDTGFQVLEAGRPFIRSVAALFDAYRDRPGARYSRAV